jgi:hypothetical protein
MARRLKQTVMVAAILGSAIAASTVPIASAREQGMQPRFFARVEEHTWVSLIDPASGASRRVHHAAATAIDGLMIAPNQARLSFIEVHAGRAAGEPPTHQLVVIDTAGRVVSRVERNVYPYTWCGVRCLAYIVGEDYEGGVGFKPQNAYTLDLKTGTETVIEGIPSAYALAWAPFDTSVYFKIFAAVNGSRVLRYSVNNGSVTPTPYKDFAFSPSGRHYLHQQDQENDTAKVYETATNRMVALPGASTVGELAGWVFDQGDYLLLARRQTPRADPGVAGIRRGSPGPVELAVYDVQSRRVVRKLEGELAPWARPRGSLALLVGDRVNVIDRP